MGNRTGPRAIAAVQHIYVVIATLIGDKGIIVTRLDKVGIDVPGISKSKVGNGNFNAISVTNSCVRNI